MSTPRDQLRLLSIFHYVLAGIGALLSLFPLLHVAFGIVLVTGRFRPSPESPGPPDPIGWIFIGAGVALILAGFAFAVLVAIAGRFLTRTRHWTFCVVIAALSCSLFPFGTVLGVFTIIVLAKTEVKALFEPGAPTLVTPSAKPPA